MAVPATLDNRTEGRLKRSTDGDELKNTLIIPDRRNAHCTTPLSCYQGQAPSGWLRSSLARNLRTIFANLHAIIWFRVSNFYVLAVTATIVLCIALAVTLLRSILSFFSILVSLIAFESSYIALFL